MRHALQPTSIDLNDLSLSAGSRRALVPWTCMADERGVRVDQIQQAAIRLDLSGLAA